MIKSTRILKTAVSLTLAALFIFSAAILTGCGIKEVTVPDVVGMTKDDAEATLKDAGLEMKVSRERFSEKNPEGTVDKMGTEAGETVESGDTVNVILSKGAGSMVPSMGSLSGEEAKNLLIAVKLNPVIEEEYSDEVEKGMIISYSDAGKTLAEGSDVTVIVSKGPEE